MEGQKINDKKYPDRLFFSLQKVEVPFTFLLYPFSRRFKQNIYLNTFNDDKQTSP
jgi:hypothetical protein